MSLRCLGAGILLCAALLPSQAAGQSADDALAIGNELQGAGRIEEAVAAFREAVRLAPGRVDAVASLSLALLRTGRPAEAIPGLRKAAEAAPQHPALAYYLGLAHFQVGQYGDARRELARVRELQPSNSQALHLYGLCLLKMNDLENGIEALESVLEIDSENRQAAYTLGSAYVKASEVDSAEALIDRYLKEDDNPEALLIKGSVLLAKGHHAEALAELEQARNTVTRLPTLHSQIGVALLYVGRRDRAAQEFRDELKVNPGDFNANAFLGWLVQQDGDAENALRLLRKAYAGNERSSGVQYLLAQVHSSRGEWDQARELLEQVVAVHQTFAPAHVMLARAYAKLKQRDLFRRQQEIIAKLNARQQELDLEGVDQLYDGRVLAMPKQ